MDSAAPATATATPNPADANRTTLDASEASATSELYRAAIGAIHTDRYQRIFERFDAADRSTPHWNWAAAFITLNWMAFRGLWGAALAYLGTVSTAVLLLFGIGRLVYSLSNEALWAASAVLLLLTIAVPGLWGNALFYAASRKRMAQALAANHTVPQACAMLLRGASSRKRLLWLALANAALVAAVLGFVLNMPTATHRPTAIAVDAPITAASTRVQGPVVATTPLPAPEPASSAMAAASAPLPAPSSPAAVPNAVPASEPVALVASAPAAAASGAVAVLAPLEPPVVAPAPALVSAPAPVSAPPVKKPAEKAVAKAKASPAAPASKSAPSPGPKFFANAGLFANEANAKNVQEKLLDAGMAAFTQQISGPRGSFTRVRVGPFKTRDEAVAAVMKIRGLGLDAEIVNPP